MDFFVMSQKKKFYEYPAHTHEYWEVLLNMEGEGITVVDGQEYKFCPGTILCIRPGSVHSEKSEGGFVDGSILFGDFCFEEEEENVLVFQDDGRGSFSMLFRLVHEYPVNLGVDVYGERFMRSVADAMQNLLRHWRNDTCKNREVLRVQKEMAARVGDADFRLDELIGSTSYSPNHFRKLFKEQCGCPPLQYYNKMRVQLAKEQLLQYKSIMTIGEIAGNCGFEDPYYFSRVFKKVTGLSPMQYFKHSKEKMPEELEELE